MGGRPVDRAAHRGDRRRRPRRRSGSTRPACCCTASARASARSSRPRSAPEQVVASATGQSASSSSGSRLSIARTGAVAERRRGFGRGARQLRCRDRPDARRDRAPQPASRARQVGALRWRAIIPARPWATTASNKARPSVAMAGTADHFVAGTQDPTQGRAGMMAPRAPGSLPAGRSKPLVAPQLPGCRQGQNPAQFELAHAPEEPTATSGPGAGPGDARLGSRSPRIRLRRPQPARRAAARNVAGPRSLPV